jgi:Type I restriction-modification system methyltransferase subunit
MTSPDKSLESWIWDAACSIRGAKDAPKYKDYILPLIFAKRLCDVFDDELNRIAKEVGSRAKPLSNLVEAISAKRLGLSDVEPDIIGRSYEYLIRKFAEGSVSSAGEFYTPTEVGFLIARIADPEPGIEVYDPCCGSAGLLVKCQLILKEKMDIRSRTNYAPLRLHGQEYVPETWAMSNMNMIIHDMEGQIELGDTFKNPKFRDANRLRTFGRVVTNPMWNQDWWKEADYEADEFDRFPRGAGFPGNKSADWGWAQIVLASLNNRGRAVIVLDTGAMSRGSGTSRKDKEKAIRQWFVESDLVSAVFLLPQDLFYNTPNAGVIMVLDKSKHRSGVVLMVDLSERYTRERPKNLLTDEAIRLALSSYTEWKTVSNLSAVVTTQEIAATVNDFNLLPNRYVQRDVPEGFEIETARRLEVGVAVLKRSMLFNVLATFEKPLGTNAGVEEMAISFEERKLGDVLQPSELRLKDLDGETPPLLSLTKNEGLIVQSERFSELAVVEDLSAYKVVRRGWIAYNPFVIWEGAIHALYDLELGIISPAYEVWIPQGIDTRYLDYLLKTPRLLNEYVRLAGGGMNRRRIVSVTDFKNITVKLPDEPSSKIVVRAIDEMAGRLHCAVADATRLALDSLRYKPSL